MLRTDGAGTTGELMLVGYQPIVSVSDSGVTTVQPQTATLTLTTGSSLLHLALFPTSGALAVVGDASPHDHGVTPSTGTLAVSGADAASLHLGAITVPTGSLTVAGIAPDFLGRLAPDTGTLTFSGTLPITGTHPTIPTSPAGEGCRDTLVTATVCEVGTTPTAPAVESVSAATSSTCHYV
jgi:hypothetical protein